MGHNQICMVVQAYIQFEIYWVEEFDTLTVWQLSNNS